jgi:hypothetical protein
VGESVFEAMPRRGELSVRDLRAIYGDGLRTMADVCVLVLDQENVAPVAARVELADRPWGWSRRPVLVCPTCEGRKDTLLARGSSLQCKGCHGQLTRQQREKQKANWVRRSGREEDRLLRLLRPTVGPSKVKVAEARRLVDDILTADHARLEELKQQLVELTVALEART